MDPNKITFPPKMQDQLEDFEFQYGAAKGKLALAIDLASEAEIATGQLAVYCRDGLNPQKPHPDVEQVQLYVRAIRQLVKDAFREEK